MGRALFIKLLAGHGGLPVLRAVPKGRLLRAWKGKNAKEPVGISSRER